MELSYPAFEWGSSVPDDCPLERSDVFRGVRFTGSSASYTNADTWYPSWAADGALYSPWTDGSIDNWTCNSHGFLAATGAARIDGDDPLNLTVTPLGTRFNSPAPYGGRYPAGSLVKDGVWFYGTYCLDATPDRGVPWDVMGPFVGFRVSRDFGVTWEEPLQTPSSPLFGESGKGDAKVKFGAPHFVDFGQEMQHSPDGKAYLTAHGATDPAAENSWIAGDAIYLARVTPVVECINDPSAYEFYAGEQGGTPSWTHNVQEAQPIISWPENLGIVTATWVPGLSRYLMWVSTSEPAIGPMNSFLAEATSLTGPWRIIAYLKNFGTQAYFLNTPSKFLSPDGTSGWLAYSANYTNEWHGTSIRPNPPTSRYGLCLHQYELLT